MAVPTHVASGKVRDIYILDSAHLLLVASDRVSAFDVVLPDTIPDKGKVLTGLSAFWFRRLPGPNHLITTDLASLPQLGIDDAAGRTMVVRRAEVIPMECVVRGYLYGSAWKEYAAGGGPSTENLPPGLEVGMALPEPIFTPATKAASGHDENLDEAAARALVGDALYEELRERSLKLYRAGAAHASTRGLLLADTKFEFGIIDGEVMLIDELLTPDSSRYWAAESWAPGDSVPSFDKQFVRDALDDLEWNHEPPAPHLPPAVIQGTRDRYVEAYERLTGEPFSAYRERHR